MAVERFVPLDIATKLMVSLGIGLLVGFEREWAHKDLGVRPFAIVSLLGMLTTLESQVLARCQSSMLPLWHPSRLRLNGFLSLRWSARRRLSGPALIPRSIRHRACISFTLPS